MSQFICKIMFIILHRDVRINIVTNGVYHSTSQILVAIVLLLIIYGVPTHCISHLIITATTVRWIYLFFRRGNIDSEQ